MKQKLLSDRLTPTLVVSVGDVAGSNDERADQPGPLQTLSHRYTRRVQKSLLVSHVFGTFFIM